MALQMTVPFLSSFLPNPRHRLTAHGFKPQIRVSKHISCSTTTPTYSTTVPRRSGNYKPSIWDYDFVQSLASNYKVETHATRVEKLKEDVKHLLKETNSSLAQMELIDNLHRLGVRWLFETEIKQALYTISLDNTNIEMKEDLHAVSTRFRLLRQHGHKVSTDVFNDFKDEKGGFKTSLSLDIKGMLSLYEASHLAFQGETILDEARAFTSTHLMDIRKNIDPVLHKKVEHALDIPLHWRIEKLEARWYMDIYTREEGMNPSLLELAKLHFNNVQTTFQRGLRSVSRWWKDLGLGEQYSSFARDRLVNSFFWAAAVTSEPQFGRCQEAVTKVIQFITTIDDIYDVYGTVDELELFTNAVDRWDLKAMEQLPEYMKTCFLALYNSINEIGYEILKEEGRNVIPYLRNAWTEMCKAYLVEAKWYSSGYTPTLEEFLQTSLISIGSLGIIMYVFALLGQNLAPESSDFVEKVSDILPLAEMLVRFPDDLGTSTDELKRGDNPKSIQCYMHEAGVREDVARDHIMGLLRETWKKINKSLVESSLPQAFINCVINLGRVAYCTYKHGDGFSDGFGDPGSQEERRFMSLFAEPLQVDEAKGISFYVDGGSA
nr:TPS1 [Cinnamomum burmanni]